MRYNSTVNRTPESCTMDYSEATREKLRIWARTPRVVPMPQITNLPRFGKKSFRSYEEMNAWKESLFRELARKGGAQWTSTSSG